MLHVKLKLHVELKKCHWRTVFVSALLAFTSLKFLISKTHGGRELNALQLANKQILSTLMHFQKKKTPTYPNTLQISNML